jgi:hypothetical protein
MKELQFLETIIIPYHKDFKKDSNLSRFALKNPLAFNVEALYEQTMNMLTGFVRVQKDHHLDATKGRHRVDWKTGSVMPSPQNSSTRNSFSTVISSIRSEAGVLKNADIGASIYNPHTTNIDHFLIPQKSLGDLVNSGGDIRGTWHKFTGYAEKIDRYNLTFKEMVAELRAK